MADSNQPTPGELAILVGGVVALVGSFLDFAGDSSAWSRTALPIVTLIPIYATVMALQVGLTKFANVSLPERVVGFTWEQIHLVLGVFATLMALFWVIAEDSQIGMWLMLLGAAGATVGAFLLQQERATGAIG